MESLRESLNKDQKYLKLGDKETFKGLYISWEKVITKFGKTGYKFILEREDGSRLEWTTSNMRAVQQIADLLDGGLKKGDPIKIYREGVEKDDTVYTITAELPF